MKRTFLALAFAAASIMPQTSWATPVAYDFDSYILLDGSRSIDAPDWELLKTFAASLIEQINPTPGGATTGFGIFATGVNDHTPTPDPASTDTLVTLYKNTLAGLSQPLGSTYTKSAIELAIDILDDTTPIRERVLFLITDGNPRPTRTQSVCTSGQTIKDDLDHAGITTFIIGIGDNWSPDALSCLVDDPDTQINFASDFPSLSTLSLPQVLGNSAAVPLPASLPLLGGGLLTMAVLRRRKRA